ncbi:MAG: hypothetical protein ACKV0T_00940 [Planctomycetales bacterium]
MTRLHPLVLASFVVLSAVWSPLPSAWGQEAAKKKKPVVRPVQAVEEEPEAPPLKSRKKPAAASENPAPRNERPTKGGGVPAAEAKSQRLPLPTERPLLRVEKLSPELERILIDWEAQSSKFRKLTGEFKRYKYDPTFEVEFQSDGKFAFEAPDKGAYEITGSKIAENALSKKKNPDGQAYRLKPGDPERWVSTGKELLRIFDLEKTYERVEIPEENRGENIVDTPLPFLFGMKAEQSKRRYKFELLESKKPYPDAIWLDVEPRELRDSYHWSKARVIINRKTYLPEAVMLTDPGGNTETVHKFTQISVNPTGVIEWLKRDPFKPDLKRYKLVMNEGSGPDSDVPAPQSGASTRPSGTGAKNARSAPPDGAARAPVRNAEAPPGGAKRKPPTTRQ